MFKKGSTFERAVNRFRKTIEELEEAELECSGAMEDSQKTIEQHQSKIEAKQEEKRKAARMRTKLMDLVGD